MREGQSPGVAARPGEGLTLQRGCCNSAAMITDRALTAPALACSLTLLLGACGLMEPKARDFPSPVPTAACEKMSVPGVEDLARDPANDDLYLSSTDRAALKQGKEVGGGIYRLRFRDGQAEVTEMSRSGPQGMAFQPHGIGLYRGANGAARLFAVNHALVEDEEGEFKPPSPPVPPHTIEIFEIDATGNALRHVQSVGDAEMLISPNDVSPDGPDSFYVSNDHGAAGGASRLFEDWFQLADANVLYYNGSGYLEVVSDLAYANGVMVDGANNRVFVASSQTGNLDIFPIDDESGRLGTPQTIDIGGGLDNVEIDARGHVWVTLHPHLRTTYFYLEGMFGTDIAPSRSVELTPNAAGNFDITTVFDDDGNLLPGASVATRIDTDHGPKLVVGPILAPHFLICDLPE